MLQIINSLRESSIDFPQKSLSKYVWNKDKEGKYQLKDQVKKKIEKVFSRYPNLKLKELTGVIYIVGSITSNQYTEDADIDVHFNVERDKLPLNLSPEEWVKDVRNFYKQNMSKQDFVKKHLIEIFLQLDLTQDKMSVGVYDFLNNRWIKGPNIVSSDFDPFEVFGDVLDIVREELKGTDILLGELKRDFIEHGVMKSALKQLTPEAQIKLKVRLEGKLVEIENDMKELIKNKKRFVSARKEASAPSEVNLALSDIQRSKKFGDANSTFKFMARYQYLRLLGDLEEILKDDKISDKEFKTIGNLLGVQ